MSTVQPSTAPDRPETGSGLHLGLKITSGFLALGLVVQAWLGSTGFFTNEPDLTTMHEMLGNVFVLAALIQVTLAVFAKRSGLATRALLNVSGLILIAAISQIGLGYAGRENADAMAWHLPNGVLLMGLSTISLVQVWGRAITRG